MTSSVLLLSPGRRRIGVIRVIRDECQVSLQRAYDLVHGDLPIVLPPPRDVRALIEKLQNEGAIIQLAEFETHHQRGERHDEER